MKGGESKTRLGESGPPGDRGGWENKPGDGWPCPPGDQSPDQRGDAPSRGLMTFYPSSLPSFIQAIELLVPQGGAAGEGVANRSEEVVQVEGFEQDAYAPCFQLAGLLLNFSLG